MPGLQVHTVFENCSLATMDPGLPGLGYVADGLIAEDGDGRIVWAGAAEDAPDIEAVRVVDLEHRWVTPGLIDCHTHLVYAGDRSDEFERRLAGESYAAIAQSGGGIAATVRSTRESNEDRLLSWSLPRIDALGADGVTTVEVKSGYGLDLITEIRQLRAARALASRRRMSVVTTYLGAHAFPPDVERDTYVQRICELVIPHLAQDGLADAVDAFMETIAFRPDEVTRVFWAAKAHGLPVKLHADQLTDGGGAAMAARFGALSADHLEYTSEFGAAAMGRAGTVAVLLPGAFLMLGETQKPPVDAFRRHGVSMAVATDLNPGSSPIASLRVAATLACVMFGLTVEEAWLGMTRNAAKALGRDDIGIIRAGARCDLAIWEVGGLAEVIAQIGPAPLWNRYTRGLWDKPLDD